MRELNRAMNEFRMMHQQPDSRREFDLYDPDYLKKDKPARVSDDDRSYRYNSLDSRLPEVLAQVLLFINVTQIATLSSM